jgi:hypothetical protein
MLTYDVPKIMSYAEADDFMNKTAPIRGTEGIRPLGRRRYWRDRWMRFCNPPHHKHSIEVGSYGLDSSTGACIRFHTDNRIEFLHGKYELCSRQIINAMFRDRLVCRYANGNKFYVYDKVKHMQYPVTEREPLVLHYPDFEFKGTLVPEQKAYVKRDVYAPIIKQYHEFLKYMEVMNKLSGGEYPESLIDGYIGRSPHQRKIDEALESIINKTMESEPDAFADAFNLILLHCADHKWYPVKKYVCTTAKLKKYVYEWVKSKYKDSIFEMRDVPNGVIIKSY